MIKQKLNNLHPFFASGCATARLLLNHVTIKKGRACNNRPWPAGGGVHKSKAVSDFTVRMHFLMLHIPEFSAAINHVNYLLKKN